jgi:trans-aconitate methyltransferase
MINSDTLHSRIPEPELMNDLEQVLAYAEADFSDTDRFFVNRLKANFPNASFSRILDLGCGPGNITYLLAEAFPNAHILGIDGAERMIDLAKKRFAGDSGLIEWDVVSLPWEKVPNHCPFDLIVSNSLLHHLHNPMVLWDAIKSAGKAGSLFWIGDLRRPDSRMEATKRVNTYAKEAPDVLKKDYFNSLLAAFTPDEIAAQLEIAGLHDVLIDCPTDRHVYISGRLAD